MNFASLGTRSAPRYRSGASLRIGTALASGLVVVLNVPAARAQTIPSGNPLPVLDAVHGVFPATITTSPNRRPLGRGPPS